MSYLSVNVYTNGWNQLTSYLKNKSLTVANIVAWQILKDTSPFVPMLTGSLNTRATVIGSKVIYFGPYARFLYYGKLMVDPQTGSSWAKKGGKKVVTDRNLVFTKAYHPQAQSYWLEASKAQNLNKWIKVAQNAVKNGY